MFVWEGLEVSDYDPRRDPVVRKLLSLSDQELASKRPELRGQVLGRYELLWAACEPHVKGKDAAGEPMFPDYRYVDLGMRILDRVTRLLQVMKPDLPEVETVVEGRDPNVVKASRDLDAIEARLRDRGEVGGSDVSSTSST